MRTPELFSLNDKNIVLTGGLGLIGRGFVQALSECGAKVFIIDLVPYSRAMEVMVGFLPKELRGSVFYFQANITNKKELLSVRKEILQKAGSLHALVNNAALNPKVEKGNVAKSTSSAFEFMDQDDWEKELLVNLTGTMLCCQVFGSVISSGGSIVNIASIYGVVAPDQTIYPKGFTKPVTYGVSKAGVINLTKYLAGHWGGKNIRVNCVVFGGVENGQDRRFVQRYAKRTLLKRMARVQDYVGILVYLLADASSYTTGAILTVDGGWTAI